MRALYTSHTHHFLLSNNVESSVWKNLANFPYSRLLNLIFFKPSHSTVVESLPSCGVVRLQIKFHIVQTFCSKTESQLLIHLKQKLNLERNKKVALF